jgi:hypothetical protein
MMAVREALARLAGRLGFIRACGLFDSEYLRSLAFDVKTIVDVGVNQGTKPLYDVFGDCRFGLVDPRGQAESFLFHKPVRYVFVNKGRLPRWGGAPFEHKRLARRRFLNARR